MPVLVETSMGELNEDRKGVFPIFQKGAKAKDTKQSQSSKELNFDTQSQNANTKSIRAGKRSKVSGPETITTPGVNGYASSQNHAELLEVDPNNSRRKRRRTASLDGKEHTSADEQPPIPKQTERIATSEPPNYASSLLDPITRTVEKSDIVTDWRIGRVSDTVDVQIHADLETNGQAFVSNVSVENPASTESGPRSSVSDRGDLNPELSSNARTRQAGSAPGNKPRKVLQLNPKTGTFGSPPRKPVVAEPPQEVNPKKKKGRGKQPKSQLVIIKYNSSLGSRIDQILNSVKLDVARSKLIRQTQINSVSNAIKHVPAGQSMKSVHPLFLGKLAPRKIPRILPPKNEALIDVTLISSPSKAQGSNARVSSATPNVVFSGFGNTAKLVKFPGAVEPAWPWDGMLHIRGNNVVLPGPHSNFVSPLPAKSKKAKGTATEIQISEYVIDVLAGALHINGIAKSITDIDLDEYPVVPPGLRTAVKHKESGISIQRRVRKELHSRSQLRMNGAADESSSDDEIQLRGLKPAPIHHALTKCYAAIATSLSAFDKGQCENQAWISKYAPQSAAEVLQVRDEVLILKGWLNALTVNAVVNSGGPSLPPKVAKRKRKTKKLDGFVISSDEDEFVQYETSENDSEVSPNKMKKSFVKGLSKESGRPKNAILISGPHGCGKTASVYAVAKELGFEVFEINSGSRRSGKDINDKVGDMTRNHLVQHATTYNSEDLNSDEKIIDDALVNDLQSGRQVTMNSFFTSQPTKPRQNPIKTPIEKPGTSKATSTSRLPPRDKKQSLILIEEVDVLYKEDTQFWPTILNLIQTSKRPIVFTCNDESLIDTSLLALQGILRFTPPPAHLAVDYMLMVAACEGHVLKRKAVQSLYETRGLDLRASLTDLNFWCQFGVGSVRGGLDWFHSHYPRSDADKDGQTIRITSEDTYQAGMGCLSQDCLESHLHHLDIEEEMLHESWDNWQLDAGDWQSNLDMAKWASGQHHPAALSMYEDFAERMSDADLISCGTMATDLDIVLDTSTLRPTQKAIDGYVLPFKMLEASPIIESSGMKHLSLWLRSRARAYLQVHQHVKHDLEVPTELDRMGEATLMQMIRKQATSTGEGMQRHHIDHAFESLSNSEKPYMISVFSGTFAPIMEDVAPYVRSIIAYDARLAQDRIRMSNLLSEGGHPGKRMRKTRAAMSALEGGARRETRRERYFNDQLNSFLVARTGMQAWMDASVAQVEAEKEATAGLENRRASSGSMGTGRTESTTDVDSEE